MYWVDYMQQVDASTVWADLSKTKNCSIKIGGCEVKITDNSGRDCHTREDFLEIAFMHRAFLVYDLSNLILR